MMSHVLCLAARVAPSTVFRADTCRDGGRFADDSKRFSVILKRRPLGKPAVIAAVTRPHHSLRTTRHSWLITGSERPLLASLIWKLLVAAAASLRVGSALSATLPLSRTVGRGLA